MTLEEVVEYFYNTLTRSALLTLYAKYYVYEQAKAGNADYAYPTNPTAMCHLAVDCHQKIQPRHPPFRYHIHIRFTRGVRSICGMLMDWLHIAKCTVAHLVDYAAHLHTHHHMPSLMD